MTARITGILVFIAFLPVTVCVVAFGVSLDCLSTILRRQRLNLFEPSPTSELGEKRAVMLKIVEEQIAAKGCEFPDRKTLCAAIDVAIRRVGA